MIIVDTPAKALELLKCLLRAPNIYGLDTETIQVNPKTQHKVDNGRVVCWSIAWLEGPVRDGIPRANCAFLWADMLPHFAPWLHNPKAKKVGHNIFNFDVHVLANMGYALNGISYDTQHMSKLHFNHPEARHGLKPLAESVLGYKMQEYKDLFSRPKQLKVKEHKETKMRKRMGQPVLVCAGSEHTFSHKEMDLIPLDSIAKDYPQRLPSLYHYASLDAKCTLELCMYFQMKLSELAV